MTRKPPTPGHPGSMIRAWLAQSGWKQTRLARELGLSQKHMSQLTLGIVNLSPRVALDLERVTGIPAEVWAVADVMYRLTQLRHEVTP